METLKMIAKGSDYSKGSVPAEKRRRMEKQGKLAGEFIKGRREMAEYAESIRRDMKETPEERKKRLAREKAAKQPKTNKTLYGSGYSADADEVLSQIKKGK